MKISDNVRAVQVPDDNPMHPMFTNIYIIGQDQVLTIDSGETMERYQWMLRGYLAATEKAEIALAAITHHHADHSGNLKWVNKEYNAEIVVHRKAIPLLKGRIPKREGLKLIEDGEAIDMGGGAKARVIFAPGHSVDSISYYIEDDGVLFTGDTLLGSSTTTVNDLGSYRESLTLLTTLPNLKVICPGHGAIVYDPRERLQGLIEHRNMRERQILKVLDDRKPRSSWDIMLEIYPGLDRRLRRAAAGNVETHLRQLEKEGRLLLHPGKPRNPSAVSVQKEIEHAKYSASVIKEAKKLEAEQRRTALRAQENPPSAQWRVQPKYELVGSARE